MHSGKEIPVELFGRHRMEWDGLDRAALAVRHHTSHDILRALDQSLNGLIGYMLGDGLVFRRRRSAPQAYDQESLPWWPGSGDTDRAAPGAAAIGR